MRFVAITYILELVYSLHRGSPDVNTDHPSKPLVFVGSSERELRILPDVIKRIAGYALRVAQQDGMHLDAKPLKGYKGAGVVEIVMDFRTDTYRTIYTVNCPDVIFVLHAFKKKSRSGLATPKPDLDLIRKRHQQALNICKSQPTELARLITEYGIAMTTYKARLTIGVHPKQDRHP